MVLNAHIFALSIKETYAADHWEEQSPELDFIALSTGLE
jgi:hypothetical protein